MVKWLAYQNKYHASNLDYRFKSYWFPSFFFIWLTLASYLLWKEVKMGSEFTLVAFRGKLILRYNFECCLLGLDIDRMSLKFCNILVFLRRVKSFAIFWFSKVRQKFCNILVFLGESKVSQYFSFYTVNQKFFNISVFLGWVKSFAMF